MKSKLGIICLLFGVILVLIALCLYIFNTSEDTRASKYSAKALEDVVDVIENNKNEINTDTASDMQMPTAEIDGESYIGYIYIPTLEDLELPVMSEWSYDRLKKSPCKYSGNVYEGNMVLLGHNYTAHFGKLSRLTQGDKVYFTDINGILYSYEVVGIDILDQTDIEAMSSGEYDLSLFTCDYSGKNRLTVRCIVSKGE
ncbi:MAG: sortase [Clostridia bacterium]|nr:sortase [Clostridia bacterium]